MKFSASIRVVVPILSTILVAFWSVIFSPSFAATVSFSPFTGYQGLDDGENQFGGWGRTRFSQTFLTRDEAIDWTRLNHSVGISEVFTDTNGSSYFASRLPDSVQTQGNPVDCGYWAGRSEEAILFPQTNTVYVYIDGISLPPFTGQQPEGPVNFLNNCRLPSGLWKHITAIPALAVRPAGQLCPTGYNLSGGQCLLAGMVPAKNLGGDLCQNLRGDPINVATGNSFQQQTDIESSNGERGLRFTRHYNSQVDSLAFALGGWTHSYSANIYRDGNSLIVHRSNGVNYYFSKQTNGSWVSDSGVTDQLEETADGWRYITSNDITETYDLSGRLVSLTQRNGQSQAVDYNALGQIDVVTDSFGKTLSFVHDARGRITEIIDTDNHSYIYGYGAAGNLVSVIYPDSTPQDLSNNPLRTYQFDDTRFPHHVTSMTDERGVRSAIWAYDSQGRAISSELDNSAEEVTIIYNANGSATVTDAQGQNHTYEFDMTQGVLQTRQILGGACTTCAGNAQSTTYDANGFVASRTDFNGNVTNFTRDTRGLELTRTEAVGTPEQRTITTTWHPDFRLPTEVIEPNKTTTFIYDANGNLLSRTETNTGP